MNRKFYEKNSGTRQVEEILSVAAHQAEGFPALLNEYLRFHLVSERLPELQAQLEEQNKLVDRLYKELKKAEDEDTKKRRKDTCAALREKYSIERDARNELARCVTVLKGVNQPEMPSWLAGFLKDVMS